MAYIYEYIRTKGFVPLHFEEHYTHLEELARRLLATPLEIDCQRLREKIAEALRGNNYSADMAHLVKVCYSASGEVKIVTGDILYGQFSVRAIRPTIGVVERVAKESLLLENSSVKDAMMELQYAKNQHLDNPNALTMWTTEQNEVVAIDGASVVVVFDDEILFSECGRGVEFELLYGVATKQYRRVTKAPLMLSDLKRAKELLFVDCRGITAIDSWDNHYYMDLTATLLASQIAKGE
ncbi:MAG: hypothetical protein J6V21_05125 [Alistipes sp.]|nr:hypothetical protein [Alistipes sp.]